MADSKLVSEVALSALASDIKAALELKANQATTYTKTETDNLLVDKADKSDTYTKEETDNEVYNVLPTDTVSGSIATFPDGGDNIPVKSFECEIVAQQASGTPTPVSPLSITGFSQADIPVCGKNLFGGTLINGDLPLNLPPDTYSFSAINLTSDNAYLYVRRSTDGVNFDLVERIIYGTTVTPKTITLESGYIYSLWSNNNYARVGNIQIEKGDTVTTYEPYKGNTYIVEFGQTVYGGRLVYSNGAWSLEVTHGILTLNGTENISLVGSGTQRRFNCGSYPIYSSILSSSHFIESGSNSNPWGYYRLVSGSALLLMDNNTQMADETALKTWLANQYSGGTPVQFVGVLATPVIIPLTYDTIINTFKGLNNIYSNTGDCELVYRADIGLYIDKKLNP